MTGKAARKRVSKGVRFEIFKRDGFTCQYCGAMPPDTVLHVDHILAIVEGGGHDDDNLITACEACNIGKGRKILDRPQKPDADLAWLEAQQEVAELRRYQEAKAERDEVKADVAAMLLQTWVDHSGLDWQPALHIVLNLMEKYPPEWIEEALIVLAPKVTSGYVKKAGGEWVKYLHGILRNRDASEMEAMGLAS